VIRVWADRHEAGVLAKMAARGSTFSYSADVDDNSAVSLTMPVRVQSWDTNFGLLPIFEMNMPEGALRERLQRKFAKATGAFDDLDLLSVVGRSQIGRIRYSGMKEFMDEDVPFQSIDEILNARRGNQLYTYLLDQFAVHSGVSGVQPKVLIRATESKLSDPKGRQSTSIQSATHIVKFWEEGEYPDLAANEYCCLLAAQRAGLDVPKFQISADGGALVVERFDFIDGNYKGFEDFCVLNGLNTAEKYKGGYEKRLFRRLRDFLPLTHAQEDLAKLFRLFVLNCAIRNGDAHLKNFGVIYNAMDEDIRLAPVYDLVTTWAYIPNDPMALTLSGSTNWPNKKALTQLGHTRAGLSSAAINEIFERTADSMSDVAADMANYFVAKEFEVSKQMAKAWETGLSQSLEAVRGLHQVKQTTPGRKST